MGPVEGTDGRYGSEIDSGSDHDTSLKPSKHIQTYGWHFLDSQLVQTVLAGVVGCLTARPPLPPLYDCATYDIKVAVKNMLKI